MCNFETAFLQRVIPKTLIGSFGFDKQAILKHKELVDRYYLSAVLKEAFEKIPLIKEDDKLMEIYSWTCSSKWESTFTQHFILNGKLLSLNSSSYLVTKGSTSHRIWEAGFALVDFFLDNREILSGKKVIELGSGSGFVGISLSILDDVQSLTLTDLSSSCDIIRSNIEKNKIKEGKKIWCTNLDWSDGYRQRSKGDDDIIIGSDLIYDPEISSHLAAVLKANSECEIYLMQCVRNRETLQNFLSQVPFLSCKEFVKECKSFYYEGEYCLIHNNKNI